MSTDTKPFAEIRPFESQHGAKLVGLFVGGHLIDWDSVSTRDAGDEMIPSLETVALYVNAAVDAHDAGLLQQAAEQVEKFANEWVRHWGHSTLGDEAAIVRPEFERLAAVVLKLAADGTIAVSGDVACGLAFDLGMEQGKTEGVMRPLIDYLFEHPGESMSLAWALARKAGIDPGSHFAWLTNDDLLDECTRRGASVRRNGGAYFANWHESTGTSMRDTMVDDNVWPGDAPLVAPRSVPVPPIDRQPGETRWVTNVERAPPPPRHVSRYASGALTATATKFSESKPRPAPRSQSERQPPSGQQPPSPAAASKPRRHRR